MNLHARSLLIMPGNNPGMIQNCCVYGADVVILDLEDAVAPDQKDVARVLVAEALRRLDFAPSRVMIRINGLAQGGEDDLAAVVPEGPVGILLPKTESPADVVAASRLIARFERQPGVVGLLPILETPLGVMRAMDVASADPRTIGLSLGGEDYASALGVTRTKGGKEIAFGREMVVNASMAVGLSAFDTPFTAIHDLDGLVEDAERAKADGFLGKLCIHPLQIEPVNRAFSPTAEEVAWARSIVDGFAAAEAAGVGVVAINGKMVDAPTVHRAHCILDLAGSIHPGMEKASC